jgi:hypothetical protein
MNPPTDLNDPLHHHARTWSAQLGELSAAVPTARPQPTQLSAALARLLQRARSRQQTAQRLRTNEFLVGE